MNATLPTLIPMGKHASTPKKFHPISLYNIAYKIITNVISARLKPLLPLLIFPKQVGCVEGRQTMENVILAHEIVHSLRIYHTLGMTIKLDFSKDFDKLSW